eukprot:g56466.t1
MNERATILSSVERYDPTNDRWEDVAPLTGPREDACAAVLDGRLYVMGGHCANEVALSSVERYDENRNCWQRRLLPEWLLLFDNVVISEQPIVATLGYLSAMNLNQRRVLARSEKTLIRNNFTEIKWFNQWHGKLNPAHDPHLVSESTVTIFLKIKYNVWDLHILLLIINVNTAQNNRDDNTVESNHGNALVRVGVCQVTQ